MDKLAAALARSAPPKRCGTACLKEFAKNEHKCYRHASVVTAKQLTAQSAGNGSSPFGLSSLLPLINPAVSTVIVYESET
mmetsp:Transcript_10062/g.14505  ORF Transcript_10062/g.14505 Transcript_10062/m.14505 type:complete len:80 (-) Transcript_10062:94-333(-)